MKNILTILFVLLVSYFPALHSQDNDTPEITAKEIQAHINYLASNELKGRFTGTPECYLAAQYIEKYFKEYSLQPLFNGSYYQEFPFISGIELTGENSLSIKMKDKKLNPELKKDWITAPFSGTTSVNANVVFAGYGISAPNLNYDDYNGIDVSGKIVIVMRYNPEYDKPHSKFGEFESFRYKANTAREKGAAGIIFVNGHKPDKDEDNLMELKYDGGASITNLAAIQVKRDIVDQLFSSNGLSFAYYQEKISKDKKPASFEFKDLTISLSTGVKQIEKTSWNVAGYIEGNDPELKNQYIVIGAHFDHLGMGETGSLYRGKEPQIHNGADDNASGTSGVIELAEKFSSEKDKLKRSIIFIGFSGEELGLLGSGYFVDHTPIPTKDMVTMLNMDMIGRLNADNQLIVYGTGTSDGFKDLLNNDNKYDFKLAFHDEGFGPSDQSSFYGKDIPVLFFFTGTHPDYHRPTDDADKINNKGEEKVLHYVYDIAENLDESADKPAYVSVPRKQGESTGQWKVYVGTVPDFGSNVEGFKLSGVSEGSPAQKAGLKGGDIMISFAGKKITNIYDYVYALKESVPGDIVDVVVLRDGKEMTFKVELSAK